MSLEQVFMLLLGCSIAAIGWFARELYAAVQNLRKDLAALEVQISRDYIRYDRLQDALKPIIDSLAEIKQSLSSKADK